MRRVFTASLTAGAVALLSSTYSEAGNLLQSLFDTLSGRSNYAATPAVAHDSAHRAWESLDRSDVHGKEFGAQRSFSGPQTTYCVRLCDGRYFPLPRRAGPANMSEAKICSAMCPAAETAVFNGRVIDHAIASDGKKYSSLKNAFLYREKTVDNCTCTPGRENGVASLDPMQDPTLRKGDVVVTPEGPKVFTGERRGGAAQSFVSPEDYGNLSGSLRQQLASLRVAQEPTGQPIPLASVPAVLHTVAERRENSIVAEAFQTFAR